MTSETEKVLPRAFGWPILSEISGDLEVARKRFWEIQGHLAVSRLAADLECGAPILSATNFELSELPTAADP